MNSKNMSINLFKKAFFNHANELGYIINNLGYLSSPTDNLIKSLNNWIEIKNELEMGQGNELKEDENGLIKFNAIHSSSALCVNSFSFIKEHHKTIEFLGHYNFEDSIFEKKISTGISTPNLDFYLETNDVIIGVESKFTEFLSKKLPNSKNNLSKYLNRKELNYLSNDFQKLILFYKEYDKSIHLDVAQLLKHSMALIKYNLTRANYIQTKKSAKPILLYIYWEPKNANEYRIFDDHRKEIENFSNQIKDFIDFKSISYPEFWKKFEADNRYSEYINQIKEKYYFEIK